MLIRTGENIFANDLPVKQNGGEKMKKSLCLCLALVVVLACFPTIVGADSKAVSSPSDNSSGTIYTIEPEGFQIRIDDEAVQAVEVFTPGFGMDFDSYAEWNFVVNNTEGLEFKVKFPEYMTPEDTFIQDASDWFVPKHPYELEQDDDGWYNYSFRFDGWNDNDVQFFVNQPENNPIALYPNGVLRFFTDIDSLTSYYDDIVSVFGSGDDYEWRYADNSIITKQWHFETEAEVAEWETIDGNEDGYGWEYAQLINNRPTLWPIWDGKGAMVSSSEEESFIMHPDNWLISPVFEAGSYVSVGGTEGDGRYGNSCIGAYITTDGGETWTQVGYYMFREAINHKYINTAEWEGQNIQIGFRHYANIPTSFYLLLDEVKVHSGGECPRNIEDSWEYPAEPVPNPDGGWHFDYWMDSPAREIIIDDPDCALGIVWSKCYVSYDDHAVLRFRVSEGTDPNYTYVQSRTDNFERHYLKDMPFDGTYYIYEFEVASHSTGFDLEQEYSWDEIDIYTPDGNYLDVIKVFRSVEEMEAYLSIDPNVIIGWSFAPETTPPPVEPTPEPVEPTPEPVEPTDEPTAEPGEPTAEPGEPTAEPGEPQPPTTGALTLAGTGVAALLAGASILFARKKENE